jgi:glucose-1-phosphatase
VLLNTRSCPEPSAIRNIIFDFGGVICNIDVKLTEKRFIALGLKSFDTEYSVAERDTIFRRLEDGSISSDDFHQAIRNYFIREVSNEEIDDAWNALLLDIPEPRIRLLESLKKNYRIFLLSNSNEIHYQKYRKDFQEKYGYPDFNGLFEKAYFSYQIRLKKPGREVFQHVLNDSHLAAAETLFIDDSLQHVTGARAVGIHAFHLNLDKGDSILDLFEG